MTMIYKMCVGDLFRFGIIYLIFLIGFTQGRSLLLYVGLTIRKNLRFLCPPTKGCGGHLVLVWIPLVSVSALALASVCTISSELMARF